MAPGFLVGVSDWWDGVTGWWDGDEPKATPSMSPDPSTISEEAAWLVTTLEVVALILVLIAAVIMLWGIARSVATAIGVELHGCKPVARAETTAVLGYYLKLGVDVLIVAALVGLSIAPTFPTLGLVGGIAGVRLLLAIVTRLETPTPVDPVSDSAAEAAAAADTSRPSRRGPTAADTTP